MVIAAIANISIMSQSRIPSTPVLTLEEEFLLLLSVLSIGLFGSSGYSGSFLPSVKSASFCFIMLPSNLCLF